MQTGARIGLHFHPERLSRNGMSVAEGLLRSGVYTNQFVAGLSSGGPSAFRVATETRGRTAFLQAPIMVRTSRLPADRNAVR